MLEIMGLETEKPKVEVLKLPHQLEWRRLLEFYRDILQEKVNEVEDVDLLNYDEELPSFIAKRLSPPPYTEEDYTLRILDDLIKEKEINSYERALMMIRDYSNTQEDFDNNKKAWERVSRYLRDHDALLSDTNEFSEKHDFVMWEKADDFKPHNPDLQPQPFPDV